MHADQPAATGRMPEWKMGTLPRPPATSWNPRLFLGPGLLMVGAAIGGGEWLMGPAATARYGGIIMGFATISILLQVIYNLEVTRYTLYCGEPIFVGFFRLRPGPIFWTVLYLFVDFFAIWPYLSASAAVPLHAAFIGRLPTEADRPTTEWIAYGVFLSAMMPLVFGGKVYNSLEKMMLAKVVLVLGYLAFVGIFMVSGRTWGEIFAGFLFFGPEGGCWTFRVVPRDPTGAEVDWALLAAFAAIAGVGGLNNSQFSTYARDKGWGMGREVGAIPSIVGGRGIALSHTGKVFALTPQARAFWSGWLRFVRRDQLMIWMVGCILGMAIPSLISLEFCRGMEIKDDHVPAATAQAIIDKGHSQAFWFMTLFCGFIVLGGAQITSMDGLIRRWTDVLWVGSKRLQHLEGNQVKYVYYGLLLAYGLWGLFVLTAFPRPLALVKVAGVLMNFALGFSAWHTLAVNCRLIPAELRPGWLPRIGLVLCGLFFVWISIMAVPRAWRDLGLPPLAIG